ncbi:MAG: hypothetical protein JW850_05275 [Thermoflexales bacterium]|nr:hypothetical protein [Thermoflexales bacterium]
MNRYRSYYPALRLLNLSLILALLLAPLAGAVRAASDSLPTEADRNPLVIETPPPPSSYSASAAPAEATPAPACALLDDPTLRGMMSGAFETALLHACNRADGLAVEQGEPPVRAPQAPQAPSAAAAALALGNDVLVNDPAGEVTSMTQSNAVVAYNEDNGVLCAAYTDSYHGVVQHLGYTGFSSSADGGASWVDRGSLNDANSFGYPSLAWRRADGRFYLATLYNGGLGLWDLGAGCDAAAWVEMIHTGTGDDKEMLAVDNNPDSPYPGRLYVAWTDFTDGHIYAARSGDGGRIWSAPVDVSGHNQVNGAWLAVDPVSGDVYAAWTHWDVYPAGPIDVEMARSTDGGATWAPLANPMSDQVNPRDATATATCGRPALNGDIRYYPYPQIAVDQDGILHAVYSYDPDGYNSGDVVNVYYRRSTDHGASWEAERRVNDNWGSTDQFFPALAVGETGAVGVFWYDRRMDSTNNLYDRYAAISRDGGLSFEANQRISDESSPVTHDAALATCYHGDYDGAAAGGGYFYTVWGDDRRGDSDVWSDSEPYFWGTLAGTVYDAATYQGLPGAWVETVYTTTGTPFSGEGDEGGYYALSVPGGSPYAVTAQVYGYAPNTVTTTVGEGGGQADIPLTPVASFWSVSGRVTDSSTGYPLRAHVTVTGDPLDPPAPYNETWSDSFTGDYALPSLAGSIAYTLTVEAEGYISQTYLAAELTAHLANIDFPLQPDLVACTAPGYELVPPCQVAAGAILWPARIEAEGCPCAPQTHELAFANHTGADEEVLISYTTSPGVSVLDMPASLGVVPNTIAQSFDVQVQVDRGVSLDAAVTVTVTAYLASNPAVSDTMVIEKRAALLDQPWEWGENAPVTAFYRGAGASLDDDAGAYAYVIGGQNAGVASGDVARYRPGIGWQTLDDKPTPAANIDAAELNGKIYVAGGYDGSYLDAFEVLDPAKHAGSQWTTLAASLPVSTGGAAMAAACGKVYLMGGNPGVDTATSTVYVYDPVNPSAWNTAAPMPYTQRYASAVTARGLIFAVGDWDTVTRVQVYDCAANAWLSGYPQLSVGRQSPGAAVVQNRYVVVYGGAPAWSFNGQPSVEILDLDNRAAGWQAGPPMNQGRMGAGGGVAGGRLIAAGGNDTDMQATNSVESIALCPACGCGVAVEKDASAGWVYPGGWITYTVVITTPDWLTGTAELVDALPAGAAFAGAVDATYGTAWYSPTANAIYWTRPAPTYSAAGAGAQLEVFTNTWASNALGLVYNPETDLARYVHEGSGPQFIHDLAYPAPHPVLHSFKLSDANPGWSDWRTGIGYDPASGHYFLTDYGGGGAYDDNIVEIGPAGRVLNAWETDGIGNDSYDGSAINNIVDIAIVPGTPPRYFATRLYDAGLVYELDLIKAGWFVTDTWGKVLTCTVPGITDTAGIDYDAQNGVLYHSDWSSNVIVVTDLACNQLVTFACGAPGARNTGVTFIEGQWPPEVWALDYSDNTTTRCQAVGREPAPEVVTVTYAVQATAPVSTTLANQATLHYRGLGLAADAPAVDTYYAAATWSDDAIHLLNAHLTNLGSFPAGAVNPNGLASDGETIWSGHYSPQRVVAYDLSGAELYSWSAALSGLQGMALANEELAIYRSASIEFHNPRTGDLVRTVPGRSSIEGLAFDGTLLWQLDGTWIYGTDPADGSVAITITNAASGCPYGGTGITADESGALTIACTNGDWFRVSSTDGSVLMTGTNGLNMYGLAYVPPHRVEDSAAVHVAPRDAITWTKEIYVNGNYLGRYDEGPFTVVPGDDVQLVDRLDYVGVEPLFVRLTEDWAGYPVTMTGEYHSRGVVTPMDGNWYVTILPGANVRLAKTLRITAPLGDGGPVTIYEWLHAEGMPPEERAVTFQPPALVKDGPAVAYNGQTIAYTITLKSQDPLLGSLRLTDTLPAGVEYAGNLHASYGNASYSSSANAVYWSNTPASSLTRAATRDSAAATPAGATTRVAPTDGPLSVQSAQAVAQPVAQLRSPQATWYNAAPLPRGRVRYAHAQCPGEPNRFYVVAGVPTSGTGHAWRYDAEVDTWATLAPFPAPTEGPSAVCYQGRIYVAGGGGANHFYIYDIVRDTWSEGPALPRGVWGAAMGAWDGRLFLAGGDDNFLFGGQSDEVDIYDIAAGTWFTDGARMPVAASVPGWAQVGQYLYVVGGWGNSFTNNITATQRYNMASNSWQTGPTFTSARGDFALVATSQYLYAIGGDADGGGAFDAVTLTERLDYANWYSAVWTDTVDPLPTALTAYGGGFCTTAKSGGEVWSVGGLTSAWVYTTTNQYRPSEPCVTIPPTATLTFRVNVTAGPGERVANTAELNWHGHVLSATSAFEVPLPDWDKQVGGVPWSPGLALSVQTSDTITVTDVISTASAFRLREEWDTARLTLLGHELTPAAGTVMTYPWEQPPAAPFAYTRFDAEYSYATGHVYFLGGRLGNGSTTGRVWEFDPASGVYTDTGVDMPSPVSNYSIARLNDSGGDEVLVIFGGRLGSGAVTNIVQGYYPASGSTATFSADLYPLATSPGGVAVVNNIAYVLGGFDGTSVTANTNLFDITAAAGSRWTAGPSLSQARSYIGVAVADGVIYAIGGDSYAAPNLVPLAIAEKLDTASPLAWDDAGVADLPLACDQMRAFGFDAASPYRLAGSIVVAGCGQYPDEYAYGLRYDVASNTWDESFPDLKEARRNHAGAFIPAGEGAGRPGLWVWGGRQDYDSNVLSGPEYYDLDAGALIWSAPAGLSQPVTLTKFFQAQAYTWTTLLHEQLAIGAWTEAREVVIGSQQPAYTLAIDVAGDGSVTRTPSQTAYLSGTLVYLVALADPGWTFSGWSGDCATVPSVTVHNAGDCELAMTAPRGVTASFVPRAPLTVTLPITDPGSYDLGAICGSVAFTHTGGTTQITVTLAYTHAGHLPGGLERRYTLWGNNSTDFDAAVTLCYEQLDLDAAHIADETQLHAYRYLGGLSWQRYSRVDPLANTVTADGVSEWGVFGMGVEGNQPTAVTLHSLRGVDAPYAWLGLLLGVGLAWAGLRRARRRR